MFFGVSSKKLQNFKTSKPLQSSLKVKSHKTDNTSQISLVGQCLLALLLLLFIAIDDHRYDIDGNDGTVHGMMLQLTPYFKHPILECQAHIGQPGGHNSIDTCLKPSALTSNTQSQICFGHRIKDTDEERPSTARHTRPMLQSSADILFCPLSSRRLLCLFFPSFGLSLSIRLIIETILALRLKCF